ncbi:MAG: hypothetical protein ACK4ME_11640 [Fimbriimonadales bacterium]
MRKRRWLLSIAVVSVGLVVSLWLLVRTPSPSATIGYFGDNKFLCVRPGQIVRLRFSEPLPTGIDEFLEKWKGVIVWTNPESAAETRYWGGFMWFEWWLVSEKEVMFRVPEGQFGPLPIKFPHPNKTKDGKKFEFMLFIMGDKDLDRMIHRQEPLPRDGSIPSKGNVKVYYEEPSVWHRLRFWLHYEAVWKRGWQIGL